VAAAQFVVGLEPFFPHNAVTEIIYRSGDVAGYTAHRIPSFFTSAHAYGGTMVSTLPLLLGGWMDKSTGRQAAIVFAVGITVSALGVFASAARLPAVLLLVLATATLFSGRVKLGYKLRWLFVAAIVAWLVAGQERLPRFTTLEDTDFVSGRIAGSVNMGFIELAQTYPLGNGLGGGGTSIPYFLQGRVRNNVAMENEYARILLEQGIPGVLLWMCFLAWILTRDYGADPSWHFARRLIRISSAAAFASGLLGIGLMTSIPGTAVLWLGLGWVATPEKVPDPVPVATMRAARPVPEQAVSSHGR
jgi:O-antigen ligase